MKKKFFPFFYIPILTSGNTVANINNSSVIYRYDLEQEITCDQSNRDEMENRELEGTDYKSVVIGYRRLGHWIHLFISIL